MRIAVDLPEPFGQEAVDRAARDLEVDAVDGHDVPEAGA